MLQLFDMPPDRAARAPRVRRLRQYLKARKLDGLFVPRQDEYMGEYVPPCAERLRWLTGFSGSAGLCLILQRQAFLFVDGRYTLQARQEVDTKLFTVMDIATTTPTQWLAQNLPANSRLGYASALHSCAQIDIWRATLETRKSRLQGLAANPIDALWTDRPPPPATAVERHALKYAGMTHSRKLAQMAKALKETSLDGFLLTQPASIAWLLNVRARDVPHTPLPLSFALLYKNATLDWFIDAARISPRLAKDLGAAVRLKPPAMLPKQLRQLGKQRIGYDPQTTAQLYGAQLRNGQALEDITILPRACKNPTEQAGMVRAHIRDGIALCRFLAWMDTQTTALDEIAVAQKLEALRKDTGALQDLSFDTISAAGPNGAIVHYRVTRASARPLRNGDIYLCDSGAQYADGTTDVTRTILIGRKAPSVAIRRAFTRVLAGHAALAQARFPPGTTGHALDVLARAPLWEDGLNFAHGTGHGVGSYLSVHEGPQHISPRPSVALHPGMVLSNEPGYYLNGQFGIRIENLMLVAPIAHRGKKDGLQRMPMLGFQTLTLAPIDRRLIDITVLPKSAEAWLNRYHARVKKAIAPALNASERAWLTRACTPLRA